MVHPVIERLRRGERGGIEVYYLGLIVIFIALLGGSAYQYVQGVRMVRQSAVTALEYSMSQAADAASSVALANSQGAYISDSAAAAKAQQAFAAYMALHPAFGYQWNSFQVFTAADAGQPVPDTNGAVIAGTVPGASCYAAVTVYIPTVTLGSIQMPSMPVPIAAIEAPNRFNGSGGSWTGG